MITSQVLEGTLPILVAFGTGTLLHVLVFRHGEWDLEAPRLLVAFVALQASIVVYLKFLVSDQQNVAILESKSVISLSCSLVFGIVVSMGVYRLFWHRLNKFPGPILARLSNFYVTSLSARHLQLYDEVEKLHKQYGDYVRLGSFYQPKRMYMLISSGPSELSVNDPNAVNAFYSNQSPCTKGPFYDLLLPRISLQTCRNKGEHSKRRKVWDRGFSTKGTRIFSLR